MKQRPPGSVITCGEWDKKVAAGFVTFKTKQEF